MKQIQIESYELIEDGHGGHYEVTARTEEFQDNQVRHSDLCTACGFSGYPECMELCLHDGGKNRD